jgi:hypothetical protein
VAELTARRAKMSGSECVMAIAMADLANTVAWIAPHDAAKPSLRRTRIGQWTLVVRRDRFSGATNCELRARAMSYARGVVTFRFGRGVQTYDAIYRVDDGPAVSWRVNAMTLASTGALAQSDDLANPSGGRVVTPLSVLSGAQTITIRPALGKKPHTFKVADLPSAMAAAEAADCGPDFLADGVR